MPEMEKHALIFGQISSISPIVVCKGLEKQIILISLISLNSMKNYVIPCMQGMLLMFLVCKGQEK